MISVLWKIPYRKAVREKGRSICIVAAVFFTTVLFVAFFSALFFVMDAAEEMMRTTSPVLADAILPVSEDEYERISQNKHVSETGVGTRFAIMQEPSGAGGIQLFAFDEKMAQWMRYYPIKGRIPKGDNEIVVSDQYLKECGFVFETGRTGGGQIVSGPDGTCAQEVQESDNDIKIQTELTYYVEDEAYTDTFTIVGIYEMSGQPLHVVWTSDAFCQKICRQLVKQGKNPEDVTYRMMGVMFSSRANIRRLVSMLTAEEGIELEEGGFFINDFSLFEDMGIGTWAAFLLLLSLIMMVGYLFISNIFQISAIKEVRFYGKLSTGGVTRKEIKRIVRRGNALLFYIAVIPALAAGYFISAAVLPGILNVGTTLQIQRSGNVMIFVMALTFSYLTVKISGGKAVKMAKNASPIERKKHIGSFGKVRTAQDKDCLTKFALRSFLSDKTKVMKVCASISLSLMLASAFYTVAEGFDVEEYVKGELDADYIFAKEPVFTNPNLNPVSYARVSEEEMMRYRTLPGIKEEGGAAMSLVNIRLPEEGVERFSRISGEYDKDEFDSSGSSGEAWVHLYGLDEMMLQKLVPIRGEIDWERFSSGGYVLLNPIYGDDNIENEACYNPGDKVTVHFRSGEEGEYTVMAIVDRMPLSLAFPQISLEGDMYLPMKTWRKMEKRTDYYLYAFDVEAGFHEAWDTALQSVADALKETGSGRTAYRSARTEAGRVGEYTDGLKLAGFVLSGVLLVMGMLNFVNCTVSGIYDRSKELAVLHSMGVEEWEIRKNLIKEGMLYMAGGIVPGMVLAFFGVYFLIAKVLAQPYITYHSYTFIYVLYAVLGCAAAVLAPWGVRRRMELKEIG